MGIIIYPVSFNAINLDTINGLTVLATNPYKVPQRKLSINSLVQSNKSKVTAGFYDKRDVLVRVGITRNTRQLLEQSIDDLNKILQGIEQELILPQSGTVRKYYATMSDMPINKDGGSYCEIDIIFTCSDLFGYDVNYTPIISVTGSTSKIRTDNFTFAGSAEWQVPVITITYTALTGGTNTDVFLGNDGTGQGITVTRTWANGDKLVVNCFNKTVTVNGEDVEFSGAFPEFAPRIGYLTYRDTHATRTYNYDARYNKRWL